MTGANVITLFRLLSAPFIGYFLRMQQFDKAFVLFILASVSDILDGYIARKYSEKTLLGRYFDPIADKILLSITTLALWDIKILPQWFLYTVILRDSLIVFGAYVLYKRGYKTDVRPHILGKISTFSQILLITYCLMVLYLNPYSLSVFTAHILFILDQILLYITEFFLIISGIFYGYYFVKTVEKHASEK